MLDAAGTLIVSSNPIGSLAANLTATLAAGQYFVQVTGVGEGDPASGGYSDYGSLGQYWINGSVVSGSGQRSTTANDDSFTVAEDSGVTALNVLDNDTTEAGESLTITAVSAGSQGGSLSIVGGNSINYQPATDFFGTETFTYTVNDGTPGSNDTATVTVTVTPVNDAPTANDDQLHRRRRQWRDRLERAEQRYDRSGREPDHHGGQRWFAGWLALDRRGNIDQLSARR